LKAFISTLKIRVAFYEEKFFKSEYRKVVILKDDFLKFVKLVDI